MRALLLLAPLALAVPLHAAEAAPSGSYRRSCSQIQTNGPILNATCRGSNGRYFDTTIDIRRCRGDISNNFGRLACGDVQGSATQIGRDNDRQQFGQRRRFGQDDDFDQDRPRGYGYGRRGYDQDDNDDFDEPPRPRRPRYVDPYQDQ